MLVGTAGEWTENRHGQFTDIAELINGDGQRLHWIRKDEHRRAVELGVDPERAPRTHEREPSTPPFNVAGMLPIHAGHVQHCRRVQCLGNRFHGQAELLRSDPRHEVGIIAGYTPGDSSLVKLISRSGQRCADGIVSHLVHWRAGGLGDRVDDGAHAANWGRDCEKAVAGRYAL